LGQGCELEYIEIHHRYKRLQLRLPPTNAWLPREILGGLEGRRSERATIYGPFVSAGAKEAKVCVSKSAFKERKEKVRSVKEGGPANFSLLTSEQV
jgi:hypothetical protein